MTNNLESIVEYIPYKEVIKKKALDYYYANKEAISQKRKENINCSHLMTKKSYKRTINNSSIIYCLKNNKNIV